MYAQVEKSKENKSRTVANSVTQKKSSGQQGFGFVDNRTDTAIQRRLQDFISTGVVQRVLIAGIDVVASANMPQWQQGGLTYHLNMTTDPAHVTCEDYPDSTRKNKNRTSKKHFFFKGSEGTIGDAVSGQRGKKKFSELPPAVQDFVNSNYNAILSVLR